MRTIAILITNLLLACLSAMAQPWTRIENLPATDFGTIANIDGVLYTGTGQKIHYSADAGQTWQQATISSNSVIVNCFAKFDGQLYVGTNNGIYSATLNNLNGTWSHTIANGWISSFAEADGVLYASTTGVGIGVFKRNVNGTWSNFSVGIPNYSGSVDKILATPGGLLAFAGANGTFYRYKVGFGWVEEYYGTTYQPGFNIDDAVLVGDILYVSRSNRLLRSDNFGYNWALDQIGLRNGHARTMSVGNDDLYVLTTIFSGDDNLTWLSKRNKNAPSQTSWAPDTETLNFFSYELVQLGDKIFIASNQGIYLKDNSLGTDLPMPNQPELVVFPNPSPDGRFFIKSATPIDLLSVYDWNGKHILTQQNLSADAEFQMPGKGMYVVKTTSGKSTKTFKVIAKCDE